jgi:hypothetical protein
VNLLLLAKTRIVQQVEEGYSESRIMLDALGKVSQSGLASKVGGPEQRPGTRLAEAQGASLFILLQPLAKANGEGLQCCSIGHCPNDVCSNFILHGSVLHG